MPENDENSDAVYVTRAMEELGYTGDFAELTTEQMSEILRRAAQLKRTENVQ